MSTAPHSGVLLRLRRSGHHADELTDGQLLECFVSHRDEAAFEAIVRRHGPMVLGVCHRILGNVQDAEDCFQATFFVLASKPNSIAPRSMIGNWLRGVAYRTSLKARSMNQKRLEKERIAATIPRLEAMEDCWQQLIPLLDSALQELPRKYSMPIVLCDLEGKTRKEAARQLGWAEGTVASRHARGRNLLAQRLTNRGLALTAATVATLLSRSAIGSCVSNPLLTATLRSASLFLVGQNVENAIPANVLGLTRGTLRTMSMTRLKIGMLFLFSVVAFGFGLFLLQPARAVTVDNVAARSNNEGDDKGSEPAKTPLKWLFEKDKPFYLKSTVTVTVASTEKAQPQDQKGVHIQTLYLLCTPIHRDGDTWTIRQRVEGIVLEWNNGGARRGIYTAFFQELGLTGSSPLRCDSIKEDRRNVFYGLYRELVGCEFTLVLDTKTMTVTKLEGQEQAKEKLLKTVPKASERVQSLLLDFLRRDSQMYLAQCTFASLPGVEKAIGDKWSRKSSLEVWGIKLEDNSTHTFVGKDQAAPLFDRISLRGSPTIHPKDNAIFTIDDKNLKTKSSGSVEYDGKIGRVVSAKKNLEVEATLTIVPTKEEVREIVKHTVTIESSDKSKLPQE